MGPLAAYSFKTALLLSVMFAVYMLSISRVKDASLRRVSLLGVYLLSLTLPLIDFTSKNTPRVSLTDVPFEAMDVKTLPATANITLPIIFDVVAMIIVGGMLIVTLISLYTVMSMLLIGLKARTVDYSCYKIKVIEGKNFSPFCFLGSIYISRNDHKDLPEMILTHEISHIRHHHFIDLILGRILLILQWWNPCCWLMARELQQVHEYQADSDVLKEGYDRKEYQYLLLSRTVGYQIAPFAISGFGQSKLKNRLKMMTSEKSGKIRKIASLLIIPGAVIALMVLSSPVVSSVTNGIATSLSNDEVFSNDEKSEDSAIVLPIPNSQPHYKINGELIDSSVMSRLSPDAIQEIFVNRQNTTEYPNGLIDITLKPGYSIEDALTDAPMPTETIEVIGHGVQKK